MIDLAYRLEVFFIGAAMMLILFGLGIAVIMPRTDRWSKRFFICFFSVLLLYGSFSIADEFILYLPHATTILMINYYFESLLSAIMLDMLTVYLLHCCGIALKSSLLFRTVTALSCIFAILVSLTPFTDLFYTSTADVPISIGPLYQLMVAPACVIMILNLISLFRWRSKLPQRYYYAFLACFLPMTVILIIHFFAPSFILLGFSIAFSAFSMIAIILSDQLDQYVRQQCEISRQRASIMVLQMRPHFIYNTMMSIYYLCKQDPDLAQQVTLDFTTYLRKNFTAIASEDLIPFTEELEHTRAYLAVEQAQFEDSLFVDYDTPHTQFRVPPLTLQPIVENAVKHGMDPDADPLHIFIRTRKTDSGSEIIVEDNGTGFDRSDNSEPHIALSNIEQRLRMMCRGEITITPRDGGGTAVKVTIPR